MQPFQPRGRAVLIGSLPLRDHRKAFDLVCEYTPDIPLWVQLPIYPDEGMMVQFLPGLPGLRVKGKDRFIDTGMKDFDDQMVAFYQEYMSIVEGDQDLDGSRFSLNQETAPGFFVLKQMSTPSTSAAAIKCQITGPITLGTGLKDQNGRSVFYDEQLRDAVVKLIALKARWQVSQLKPIGRPVLIFFDEPALAGFGSSAFISITPDEIASCFEEVIEAVHAAGGLAGIHVCANTEWSLILESAADIVSFDAYSYFDKFILYPGGIAEFIGRGGMVAWGIVPTSQKEDIERETAGSLAAIWEAQFQAIVKLGVDPQRLFSQTLVTPACGTGSLDESHARKVLELTRDVSNRIRKNF